jgi:hypothetical protein
MKLVNWEESYLAKSTMESIDTVARASDVVTDSIGTTTQASSRVDTSRIRRWWWQSDWTWRGAVRQ